mgnify:CR=1 FL=1
MTHDGDIYTGPIQGGSGKLGNSALYLGLAAARDIALRGLAKQVGRAKDNRELSIYEPKPGHVAIYPDYSDESDGKPVAVSLLDDYFELAPE